MKHSRVKRPRTVGTLMKKGIDPVGVHVMNAEGKLGTVRAVLVEDREVGFAHILDVRHFNGEPWDYQPYPDLVFLIEKKGDNKSQ